MESYWAPTVFNEKQPNPRQLLFEEKRVKMVLKAFHLEKRLFDLINDYDLRWGVKRVTFESFMRLFPTFPVMLDAQSFYGTTANNRWMKLSALFDNFQGTFIYERYQLLLDRYRRFSNPENKTFVETVPPTLRGLPLAMAFPCDDIRGGLIIHNAPEPLSSGLKFLVECPDDEGRPQRLWVEKFADWLDVLARRGWTPASPVVRHKLKRKHPISGRGAVMRPWMIQICGGPGADTYLLAWLWRMFRPKANLYEIRLRHFDEDGLWVAFSQKRLAPNIGISEPQMKRAIKSLRNRGFIETKTRSVDGSTPRTHIRLIRDVIKKARDPVASERS